MVPILSQGELIKIKSAFIILCDFHLMPQSGPRYLPHYCYGHRNYLGLDESRPHPQILKKKFLPWWLNESKSIFSSSLSSSRSCLGDPPPLFIDLKYWDHLVRPASFFKRFSFALLWEKKAIRILSQNIAMSNLIDKMALINYQ